MTRFQYGVLLLVSLVTATLLPTTANAADEATPTQVTLYPAAVPRPALKHQLTPDFMDRLDANAVVYLGMVKSEQNAFFGDRELQDEKIERWRQEPLEALRGVEQFLASRESGPLYYLDQVARCTHADWQLPLGREPYYSMLLPSVQESRQFARILAAHARIAMAHGDFETALADIRTGFALGRHVSANETLVAGLVGMAISNIMCEQLITLMQQPDAPNLYWALTQLPAPLIDLRTAVDAEMHGAELSIAELRNLDSARTPEEWRRTLFTLAEHVTEWTSGRPKEISRPVLIAEIARAYPRAKRALIEQGLATDTVAAMPVAQVILLHEFRSFEELREDAAKWYFLTYPDAVAGLRAADERVAMSSRERAHVFPLAETFLPALEACRGAQVRCDRTIAVLRVLEALRIYGAAHGGRLPDRLSDVTEVPVPEDPVTAAPFEYEVQDGVARLRSPAVTGQAIDYEIRMSELER